MNIAMRKILLYTDISLQDYIYPRFIYWFR